MTTGWKCIRWGNKGKEIFRSFGRSWYGPQQRNKTDGNQPKRMGSGRTKLAALQLAPKGAEREGMPPQPSNTGVAVFQHFTARPNLPGNIVQVIDYLNRGGRWLFDAVMGTLPQGCPRCGHETRCTGMAKSSILTTPPRWAACSCSPVRRRYKCLGCRKPFYEPVPDLDDRWRATRRLVREIALGSLRYPFTHLASIHGLAKDDSPHRAHFLQIVECSGIFPDALAGWVLTMSSQEAAAYGSDKSSTGNSMTCCRILARKRSVQFLEVPGTEFIEIVCMDFSTLIFGNRCVLVCLMRRSSSISITSFNGLSSR